MRATVLNSSPHSGGTSHQLALRLTGLLEKRGFEVARFDLYRLKIGECLGCFSQGAERCTYPCVVSDDMDQIYGALLGSDAAIFVTPTYWANVPGKLKNLVDRLTSLENNGFLLEGLVVGVIAINQVGGGWEAASWLAGVLNMMGALIPPYAIQVFYPKSLQEKLEALDSAKEYWGDRDLVVLADNLAYLCGLGLRGHGFGFRGAAPQGAPGASRKGHAKRRL